MKKVVVAHPGKQHSYRLAEALKREGMLLAYITTVYNHRGSWTHILGQLLRGDNKKRFLTRQNDFFDDEVVQYCELRGLLYLLLLRLIPKSRITRFLEKNIHTNVYNRAIRLALKQKADAIVVYGGLRKEHFALRDKLCPALKIIVDVPIVTNPYVAETLEKDIIITGDNYVRHEQASIWDSAGWHNIKCWCRNGDGFLAGSSVVKQSLIFCGANTKKIQIVPYGVDTSRFYEKDYTLNHTCIRFIFVGQVNRRKGIQHLLPAFKRLNSTDAQLTLVGKYDVNDPLVKEFSQYNNICFKGFVTQDTVAHLYRENDVFVLPSLGEGLAQVGIEAMSCGLPIICSDNSGVNDLITDGKEGFVIPTSDENALYEKLEWFVEHREMIHEMGKNAHITANRNSWEYYSQNVVKAIQSILGDMSE